MPANDRTSSAGVARWRWWLHLVLIGGYILPGLLLSLGREQRHPALTSNAHGLLLVCGIEIALFVVAFALGWLASRASADDLLLRWRPGWWVVPLGVIYSIGIRVAVGLVLFAIICSLLAARVLTPDSLKQSLANNSPDVQKLVDVSAMQHDSTYFWLTVTIVSFVVAGLREELWRAGTLAGLRALWPEMFGARDGQFAAIALIAVAFGGAHFGMGTMAVGLTGLLGLCLGIIMIYHNSIWPAVIAHGLFDATTFALLPYGLRHLSGLH